MIADKALRAHYERAEFVLPFDSKHRFFQFEFGENRRYMPVVRKAIRTPEDLRRLALARLPQAIYCSRGRWVDAPNLPLYRNQNHTHPFLGGDVVADFDEKDFPSKEECRLEALRFAGMGEVRYMTGALTVFSGRGWHVHFPGAFVGNAKDGKTREYQFRVFLKKEFRHWRAFGFFRGKFDAAVFCNPRQVFRVPGSLNPKNGRLVEIHSPAEQAAKDEPAKTGTPRNPSEGPS